MSGKMNAGQKRVSRQIRDFCKRHAYKAQFDFKLFPLDYYNQYGQRLALCEYGIVTIWVGAVIDNWRDYPTKKLQQFLDNAKKLVEKDENKETVKNPTNVIVGTSNFVSKIKAIKYYKTQESDTVEVNRKIKDGEILIGKPNVPKGMSLCINHEEGRYFLKNVS
jgi:hypothetical protein